MARVIEFKEEQTEYILKMILKIAGFSELPNGDWTILATEENEQRISDVYTLLEMIANIIRLEAEVGTTYTFHWNSP